jgi:chromosome segregation ATPase
MNKPGIAILSWVVILACAAAPASAQAPRGGEPSAAAMQQLQELASERTALQADNARMKQQLADVTKERDALKKGQQTLEQHSREAAAALVQSAGQRTATEQQLEQTKAKMQELVAKFRDTVQTLRQIEMEGSAAKRDLATRDQQLKVCVEHNVALYQISGEVLTHLEHDSVWAHIERAEPFTRIKRVQLENLVDDYKARADDARVKPGSVPPPTSPPPAGPTPPSSTPGSQPPTSGPAH